MSGFDYATVWTASLGSRRVIVHLPLWYPEERVKVEQRENGTRRESYMVACGSVARYIVDYDADGHVAADYMPGTLLANGHAAALGAHYCGRCWPAPVPAGPGSEGKAER